MNFFLINLLIFVLIAIPSSFYDIKNLKIPLFYVIFGYFLLLGFYFFHFEFQFAPFIKKSIIGFALTVLLLILARLFSNGGLGIGDIIFGGFCGLFLSFPNCFIGMGLSCICGLIFFLFSKKIKLKKNNGVNIIKIRFVLPYVPFLTAGTLISFLLKILVNF